MIRRLELENAREHIFECTSGYSGQVLGLKKTYSPYFFIEAHNGLQNISRKSGVGVRNPFGNAMVRLLWFGITSNHSLGH